MEPDKVSPLSARPAHTTGLLGSDTEVFLSSKSGLFKHIRGCPSI